MSDVSAVRRVNRTIAQFSFRFMIASDRSSDQLAIRYADKVPTAAVELRRPSPKEIQIIWKHVFGPPPRRSQYIDTPEKAASLEAQMAADRTAGDAPDPGAEESK